MWSGRERLWQCGYYFFSFVYTRRFSNHESRLFSQSHTFAIYIIITQFSVGWFVCLSGLLLWNGKAHQAQTRWVGGAWSNLDFWGIAGVKGHAGVSQGQPGVKMLKYVLWLPNLVGRTPDQSVMYYWGQRSCRGQLGSRRGQIALICPMATKFGRKNPRPKHNALLVWKVMMGSSRGQFA